MGSNFHRNRVLVVKVPGSPLENEKSACVMHSFCLEKLYCTISDQRPAQSKNENSGAGHNFIVE